MRIAIQSFAAALVLLFSLQVNAAFSALYAFGDSLTDNGNAFIGQGGLTETVPYANSVPSFSYPGSHLFSNGPVWVDYVADDLSLSLNPSSFFGLPGFPSGTNFALGGSRTGTLDFGGVIVDDQLDYGVVQQVGVAQLFLGPVLPSDGLYLLNGGGNDIREAGRLVGLGTITGATAIATMSQGAANLVAAVNALVMAGANHIAVANVPDVGRTPDLMAQDLLIPGAAAFATSLATAFNEALNVALSPLIADPALNVMLLDNFTLTNHVLDNPGSFGLTNTTDACTLENAGAGCGNPDQYAFWDGIHPTTAFHRIAADATLAAVVPVPAAVWFLASGFGLLVSLRKRPNHD
jgi:outer membrane lipase/esterase